MNNEENKIPDTDILKKLFSGDMSGVDSMLENMRQTLSGFKEMEQSILQSIGGEDMLAAINKKEAETEDVTEEEADKVAEHLGEKAQSAFETKHKKTRRGKGKKN